jgi:hypothetical protein
VELTDKIDDKVRDTQEMTVSADGKTMTVRIESSGRTRPNVLVFEKE